MSWALSVAYAIQRGGRLLTNQEIRQYLQTKPLYPGEDQWCATYERDWVNVGYSAGTSHVLDYGEYPDWGDTADKEHKFKFVILYTKQAFDFDDYMVQVINETT